MHVAVPSVVRAVLGPLARSARYCEAVSPGNGDGPRVCGGRLGEGFHVVRLARRPDLRGRPAGRRGPLSSKASSCGRSRRAGLLAYGLVKRPITVAGQRRTLTGFPILPRDHSACARRRCGHPSGVRCAVVNVWKCSRASAGRYASVRGGGHGIYAGRLSLRAPRASAALRRPSGRR